MGHQEIAYSIALMTNDWEQALLLNNRLYENSFKKGDKKELQKLAQEAHMIQEEIFKLNSGGTA